MRCVLVSCCGLPAAGKTTFCRLVASDSITAVPAASWTSTAAAKPGAQVEGPGPKREGNARVRVSHICFDEFIDHARRRRRPCNSENNTCNSPSTRNTIPDSTLGTGDEVVEATRATEMAPCAAGLAASSEDSARLWHEGRRAALAEVEALASAQRNMIDSRVVATPAVASAEACGSPTGRREGPRPTEEAAPAIHAVLVDDNMHFRTMRHEVFSLAVKYGCSYAQVYFPTDVELAVERNEARGTPVAEAVIRKMAANIQPPDPKHFKWERHTAVVGVTRDWASSNPRGPCTSGGTSQERNEPGREGCGWEDSDVQQSFLRVIAAASAEDLTAPSSPVSAAASLLQQEADRKATRASLLHKFDLELRESVKRVATRAADTGLSSEVLRAVMQACSASRKNAMRRAKKAAGKQSKAGEVFPRIAPSLAVNQNTGDGGGPGFPARLSNLERFVVEFEEVVGNVEGIGRPIRETLVAAARLPA